VPKEEYVWGQGSRGLPSSRKGPTEFEAGGTRANNALASALDENGIIGEGGTMAKKKALGVQESLSVDAYIAGCPGAVRPALESIRTAIREVAPDAVETTRYFQIPGYSYPGYDYNGMFVWFSFKEPNIRLHVRPPTIQEHTKELGAYSTTKAIVSFPADKPVPRSLVKRLVKASLRVMRNRA